MNLHRTKFETEMQVRPDDIDMFQHVHSSKYLDYVLAARLVVIGLITLLFMLRVI